MAVQSVNCKCGSVFRVETGGMEVFNCTCPSCDKTFEVNLKSSGSNLERAESNTTHGSLPVSSKPRQNEHPVVTCGCGHRFPVATTSKSFQCRCPKCQTLLQVGNANAPQNGLNPESRTNPNLMPRAPQNSLGKPADPVGHQHGQHPRPAATSYAKPKPAKKKKRLSKKKKEKNGWWYIRHLITIKFAAVVVFGAVVLVATLITYPKEINLLAFSCIALPFALIGYLVYRSFVRLYTEYR